MIFLLALLSVALGVNAFSPIHIGRNCRTPLHATTSNNNKLSDLPNGISPFEKSLSKTIDIQADFRSRAKAAAETAISNGVKLLEIEFPPLIGGQKSKSQFDDFDNIQELDSNKDWTMQFAALLSSTQVNSDFNGKKLWIVFPDLKECELARKEWQGKLYQKFTFTTIEAATNAASSSKQGSGYDAPWGAAFVSTMSKWMGGSKGDAGLLGDQDSLDPLIAGDNFPPSLALIIQPGNGGPVEDWCNCETIYDGLTNNGGDATSPTMVIVNGALDKLRGGYYPPFVFPKLAASVNRFFTKFETAFYLKPISDKGVYGWLYRVYPEPWQLVLQRYPTNSKKPQSSVIENIRVHVSHKRPTYAEAVAMLVQAASSSSN